MATPKIISPRVSLPRAILNLSSPASLSWPQPASSFSSSPGIYWFQNAEFQVLYIGKAKNLKHRLKSYLNPKGNLKTAVMLSHSSYFGWIELDNELQALLYEASLIKHFQPHYNIELKDDKSPLYVGITRDLFPRVLLIRKNQLLDHQLEAYFGPFVPASSARNLLLSLRPIFPYCNQAASNTKLNRPCFYYHLKLCPGACCGQITPSQYAQNIQSLTAFLGGQIGRVQKFLKQRIADASAHQQFESAASFKQALSKLDLLQSSYRFSAWSYNSDTAVPDKSLSQLSQLLAPFFPDQVLNLNRIEAYDIANIQGKNATGSMVVFINGVPAPSHYRHFHIRNLTSPNDPAMLAQILKRRLQHPQWSLPGLFLIDGGATQLSVIHKYTPPQIPLAGIAKHPDHLIIFSGQHEFKRVDLPPQALSTFLLQRLRDEAHRFARRLHHQSILKKYR